MDAASNSLASIPWHPGVRILRYEPQWGLMAVSKPTAVLSHPNRNDGSVARSALVRAYYNHEKERYEWEGRFLFLLHRLDSPTSGILLLTMNERTAARVKNLFSERKIHKEYVALVGGLMGENNVWEDLLNVSQNDRHQRRTFSHPSGKHTAFTHVSPTGYGQNRGIPMTQITLIPSTGRTHQLRVQCAHHGFPILGDKTYGNFALNRKLKTSRLYLHAAKIRFPLEDSFFEAEDPVPFGVADFDGKV